MASLVTYLLGVSTAILAIVVIRRVIDWWIFLNRCNRIPGPKHHWFFGLAHYVLFASAEDYMEIFQREIQEYMKTGHPVGHGRMFHLIYMAINTAKGAEILLKSTTEINKTDDYKLLRPWLGFGLLTSTGKKWQSHRKLLTPSFHFNILENFVSVFNEQSKILVKQLEKQIGKGSFNICPFISLCTLDIICESAMGKKINAQTHSDSKYVKAVVTLTDLIFKKFIFVWRTIPLIYFFYPDKIREGKCLETVHEFTQGVIRERKAERVQLKSAPSSSESEEPVEVYGGKRRMAFLDTLLETIENGEGYLTDKEIREEVDTFMFEGHDTTASGLVAAIMNLALHQDVQEKAHQEINSIFGDTDRPVEMADLTKMKYLEAIIKETLRLFPPVPIYGRTLKEDLVVEGYTLPKGCNVLINQYAVHRDPLAYKDPHNFNPSRFLKEDNDDKRHAFSFLAFSAGPRNCIGQKFALMEEKVVLTYILRNYIIGGQWTEKRAKMSLSLISRPMRGVTVTLTKR